MEERGDAARCRRRNRCMSSYVGVRLGDAGDGATPDSRDELHAHPRVAVRVLQSVNQLGEVFDGINIVVRRR